MIKRTTRAMCARKLFSEQMFFTSTDLVSENRRMETPSRWTKRRSLVLLCLLDHAIAARLQDQSEIEQELSVARIRPEASLLAPLTCSAGRFELLHDIRGSVRAEREIAVAQSAEGFLNVRRLRGLVRNMLDGKIYYARGRLENSLRPRHSRRRYPSASQTPKRL